MLMTWNTAWKRSYEIEKSP